MPADFPARADAARARLRRRTLDGGAFVRRGYAALEDFKAARARGDLAEQHDKAAFLAALCRVFVESNPIGGDTEK